MSEKQQQTCVELRKDGTPCRALALPGNTRCWAHAEELESIRTRARAKGGENSAAAKRALRLLPERLEPVVLALEAALTEVHHGKLPATRGQAMASIARALVFAYQVGEMEERLRRLEEATETSPMRWQA